MYCCVDADTVQLEYNYERLQSSYDTITIKVQYQHNAGRGVGNRERSLAHRDGIVRILELEGGAA